MKKHMLSLLCLAAGILITSPLASADPTRDVPKDSGKTASVSDKDVPPSLRTPLIDRRLERMRQLIVKGIEAGQLTPGEATSLHQDLKQIERREKSMKNNDSMSRRERISLNRDINELHEEIWKKTHNGAKPDKPIAE